MLKMRGVGLGAEVGAPSRAAPLPPGSIPIRGEWSRLYHSDFLWPQATVTLRRNCSLSPTCIYKEQAQEVKDTPK